MSATPTAAPSRAKRIAPARPIPEAAAVTIPIFRSSRIFPLLQYPIPPLSRMWRRAGRAYSSRDFLCVVERVERGAIRFADRVTLDLQGRGHLAVSDRERFG